MSELDGECKLVGDSLPWSCGDQGQFLALHALRGGLASDDTSALSVPSGPLESVPGKLVRI